MTNYASAITQILSDQAERSQRGWSAQGIYAAANAALDEDRRTPAEVVRAGLDAIADPTAKTPGAIRWPIRYLATSQAPSHDTRPRCATCGRMEAVHEVAESKVPTGSRHTFQAVAR